MVCSCGVGLPSVHSTNCPLQTQDDLKISHSKRKKCNELVGWWYGCFFLTFSLTWTSLLHILGDPSFICLFGLLVPSIVCTHKPWSIICSFQFLQICSQILDLGGTQTLQQSVNQGTPSITRQPIKVYNNQVNIIIWALALGLGLIILFREPILMTIYVYLQAKTTFRTLPTIIPLLLEVR